MAKNKFANYIDRLGSSLHLPEFGISEMLAGGQPTINTSTPVGPDWTRGVVPVKDSFHNTLTPLTLHNGTTFVPFVGPVSQNTPNIVPVGNNLYQLAGGQTTQNNSNSMTSNGLTSNGSTGSGSGATNGSGGDQPVSLGFFNGKEYFDPTQLYNDQLAFLDATYGTNLSTLNKNKQTQLDAYGKQKTDVANQLTDLLGTYDKNQATGQQNLNTYYSGLGDITQSSQGTRESNLLNDIATARTKANTQATDQQSALDKAIATYQDQSTGSQNDLATKYQQTKDTMANQIVNDIASRLATQQLAAQGVDTGLSTQQINDNSNLLPLLQNAKARLFNSNLGGNGQINTSSILQYLAGMA